MEAVLEGAYHGLVEQWWCEADEEYLRRGEVPAHILTHLTYGEITADGVRCLLHTLVSLRAFSQCRCREVFYDLGSGFGRLVLQLVLRCIIPDSSDKAPVSFDARFRKVAGIELLTERHAIAVAAWSALKNNAAVQAGGGSIPTVEFLPGDILLADLSYTTVIYLSSLCFPEELLSECAAKLDCQPNVHTVFTLKTLPVTSFRLIDVCFVEMSWEPDVPVYLYERLQLYPLYHPFSTICSELALTLQLLNRDRDRDRDRARGGASTVLLISTS
jgi:SAM-dependent methyltransferase